MKALLYDMLGSNVAEYFGDEVYQCLLLYLVVLFLLYKCRTNRSMGSNHI
jgi:hypothetical protein